MNIKPQLTSLAWSEISAQLVGQFNHLNVQLWNQLWPELNNNLVHRQLRRQLNFSLTSQLEKELT